MSEERADYVVGVINQLSDNNMKENLKRGQELLSKMSDEDFVAFIDECTPKEEKEKVEVSINTEKTFDPNSEVEKTYNILIVMLWNSIMLY